MLGFDIGNLIPGFILRDKNGYALSKALEAGLNVFLAVIERGIDIMTDVDQMPEWRLDEMAYELGCLYDHRADIEMKRKWIRNALPYFSNMGTKQAILNYLEGYFDDVIVEESSEYGGEPFHFRVTAFGDWTTNNEVWARKAVLEAKNVRSVLDLLGPGAKTGLTVASQRSEAGRFDYEKAGTEIYNEVQEV